MDEVELEGAVCDIEAKLDDLTKQLTRAMASKPNEPAKPAIDLDAVAKAIRERDGCSGLEALTKARRELPADAFNRVGSTTSADFDTLVDAEINGSCMSRTVAAQRVLQKYGPRPAAAKILKARSAGNDFEAEVDRVAVAKRCPRNAAMAEVRRSRPDLFAAYQDT
jgi:hypothetical protein